MGKHKDNERKKKEAARNKTADAQIDKLLNGGFVRGQLTVDSVINGPNRPTLRSQMMGGHAHQVPKEPKDPR